MTKYELSALVGNSYLVRKDLWESQRFSALITAQCNSTKPIKASDILTLPWEVTEKEEATPEDIERVRTIQEKFLKRMQDGERL